MSKEKLNQKVEKITELTTAFCNFKLDEEYQEVIDLVIGKLSRKRPSPLLRGDEKNWAAGIIYAVGQVNYLFDKSFEPYTSVPQICSFFKTKKSTTTNKASDIRKTLKMDKGSGYMTKTMKREHPMNQYVMVNGFIVHISNLPPEQQAMVREARDKGLDISFKTVDE